MVSIKICFYYFFFRDAVNVICVTSSHDFQGSVISLPNGRACVNDSILRNVQCSILYVGTEFTVCEGNSFITTFLFLLIWRYLKRAYVFKTVKSNLFSRFQCIFITNFAIDRKGWRDDHYRVYTSRVSLSVILNENCHYRISLFGPDSM